MKRNGSLRASARRNQARDSILEVQRLARSLRVPLQEAPQERAVARAPRGLREAVWSGTEVNRLFADWLSSVRPADDEIRWGIRRLRGRARDLARNDAYARKFLLLLAANVIGPTGFKFQSRVTEADGKTLAKAVNDPIEAAWKDWSEGRVTVDGRLTLVQFEQLLLKTVGRDGEGFVRIFQGFPDNPHGLAVQGIDADMLDEHLNRAAGNGLNEIRMGIEVDELGRRVAYHFDRPRNSSGSTRREAVPASEIIHLYIPERLNQTRGVSWFHSVMAPLKMLGGYEEAELVAARTAAAKMGFIQARDSALTDVGGQLNKEVTVDADPGKMEQLPSGWEFVGWDPTHPVQAFPTFVKAILRKAASGLPVSYNALADDLESVNYSSMRSGLLLEREQWRVLQHWWLADFRTPLYPLWLSLSLLTGALKLPTGRGWRAVNKPKFGPRGWPWVDPLRDIQAAIQAIENRMGSRSRFLAEQGEDYEETLTELVQEEELAAQVGLTGEGDNERAE